MRCGQTGARRTTTRTKADDNVGGPATNPIDTNRSNAFSLGRPRPFPATTGRRSPTFCEELGEEQNKQDGPTRENDDKIKMEKKGKGNRRDNDGSIRAKREKGTEGDTIK
jgi:hypothetical protein